MFRICLFTAIEGTITDRGQPVIGALVERSAHLIFNNKKKKDSCITDENGRFSFPEMRKLFLWSWLPFEHRVEQRIVVRHQGRKVLAWRLAKHDFESGGEFCTLSHPPKLDRPIEISCELTDEERVFKLKYGSLYGQAKVLYPSIQEEIIVIKSLLES